jgi:hypothetical protein
MADKPANENLWNTLVSQAKAKFNTWPSIPASKWVHEQYVQRGGRFITAEDRKHDKVRRAFVERQSKRPAKRDDKKDNKK